MLYLLACGLFRRGRYKTVHHDIASVCMQWCQNYIQVMVQDFLLENLSFLWLEYMIQQVAGVDSNDSKAKM